MAHTINVDLPKRLGGHHPLHLATTSALVSDPRRRPEDAPISPVSALAPKASGPTGPTPHSRTPTTDPRRRPRDAPISPVSASAPKPSGLNVSTSLSETPPSSTSGEKPHLANFMNPASLIDLVNSSIKISKHEDEKSRLEDEVAHLAKGVQNASQFQQSPMSTIASYQSQLERAQTELAKHTKAIDQHRAIVAKAETHINKAFSEPKPDPQIAILLAKVSKLESAQNELKLRAEKSGIGETGGSGSHASTKSPVGPARMNSQLPTSHHHTDITAELLQRITKLEDSVDLFASQQTQLRSRPPVLEPQCQQTTETAEGASTTCAESTERETNAVGNSHGVYTQQCEDSLAGVNQDASSLNVNQRALAKNTENNDSQLSNEMEARKKAITEQIATEEERLGRLLALHHGQEQASTTDSEIHRGLVGNNLTKFDERLQMHEKAISRHDEILDKILDINSNVQESFSKEMRDALDKVTQVRFEIDKLWKTQSEGQSASNNRFWDTTRRLDALATHSDENKVTKAEFADLQSQLKALSLSHDTTFEKVKQMIDPLLRIPGDVKKSESLIETLMQAIRSLESRYTNLTTGDLVNLMAQEMHKMYPSVGQLNNKFTHDFNQLSQQFAANLAEIARKVSIHTELGATKEEVLQVKEGLVKAQKEIAMAMDSMADFQKAESDLSKQHAQEISQLEKHAQDKALKDAQERALLDTSNAQEEKVTPEQLQALNEVPALAQKVRELFELWSRTQDTSNAQEANVTPEQLQALNEVPALVQSVRELYEAQSGPLKLLETTINQHDSQLHARLEESSALENRVETLNDSLEELSESLDQLKGDHHDALVLVDKAGSVRQDVDNLASELQNAVKDLASRASLLDMVNADVEGLLKAGTFQNDAQTKFFAQYNARLESLEHSAKDMVSRDDTAEQDLAELLTRFGEMESAQRERDKTLTGFLKRLRALEDTVLPRGSNRPIEQRVEAPQPQPQPQPLANGPKALEGSRHLAHKPSPSPHRPQLSAKRSENSASPAPPTTLSLLSSGKTPTLRETVALNKDKCTVTENPENPHIQRLKKPKRRRETMGSDFGANNSDTLSVSDYSPVPTSPALSGSSADGLSRKAQKQHQEKERQKERDKAEKKKKKAEKKAAGPTAKKRKI